MLSVECAFVEHSNRCKFGSVAVCPGLTTSKFWPTPNSNAKVPYPVTAALVCGDPESMMTVDRPDENLTKPLKGACCRTLPRCPARASVSSIISMAIVPAPLNRANCPSACRHMRLTAAIWLIFLSSLDMVSMPDDDAALRISTRSRISFRCMSGMRLLCPPSSKVT